jgi:hypothetical protein
MKQFDQPAAWVESVVHSFCSGPENTLQNSAQDRAWDDPLVGFSSVTSSADGFFSALLKYAFSRDY